MLVIEDHQPAQLLGAASLIENDRIAIRRPAWQEIPIGGASVYQEGLFLTHVAHDPNLQSIGQEAVTSVNNLFSIR